MSNPLTWKDLPNDVTFWPALPLSLSGSEVMPLDYHAGQSGWVLYGCGLNKLRFVQFQRQLGSALVMVAAWHFEHYTLIRLAGPLSQQAITLAHSMQLDVVPLGRLPHLHTPGLLLMDMDSTAIQIECIDEIARLSGCGDQVAAITERAMRGEIDFSSSLRQRVAALKGIDAAILYQIRANLPVTPGLHSLVHNLKTFGWKIAIASGGFDFFADHLRDQLLLTSAIANQLVIDNGKLTGQLNGPIIDAACKAKTLQQLAEQHQIPLVQTVAIGDGANDLPMLQTAGVGIAFHAKPKVEQLAPVIIRHGDLLAVFAILTSTLSQQQREKMLAHNEAANG